VSWCNTHIFEIITNPWIWLISCIKTIMILKICNISQWPSLWTVNGARIDWNNVAITNMTVTFPSKI
jgi:hypothetical protein